MIGKAYNAGLDDANLSKEELALTIAGLGVLVRRVENGIDLGTALSFEPRVVGV